MVLAAGLGMRLRPLSLLRAKPALPVLNRPLLHWTLERLAASGVREVVINTHHLPGTVRRAVEDGRGLGLTVVYSHEPRILGTGGGPRKVRRWLGDEPFLLVNGDVLFDFDLRRVVERHLASGARATLVLKHHPEVEAYGAVVTDGRGWIRSVAGLPRRARGRAALFTGIHVLDPSLLDRLPPGPSDSVRDLYVPLLAEGERLLGVRPRGAWYDFGSPALYLSSQLALLARGFGGVSGRALIHPQARVHPTARLARCVVGAGCVVGEGGRVSASVLWDGSVVGPRARVERCILASGIRVEPSERIERKVVVPATRVRPGFRADRALVELR